MDVRAWWILLVLPALAGCIADGDDAEGLDGEGPATAYDPLGGLDVSLDVDHDHFDLALHSHLTPGMTMLSHEGFTDWAHVTNVAEMDALDETTLAVASVARGVFLVDVSDPEAPQVLGHIPLQGPTQDVKGYRGTHLFVATQTGGNMGVQAYDVRVPQAPVLVGSWPMPTGCHMIAVYEDHLYCAPSADTVRIFRIDATPAAVLLVPVGVYAPYGGGEFPVFAPDVVSQHSTHDMTVQPDPLTGEPVMYVSFWDDGVHAVDVSDPSDPQRLGVWDGAGAGDFYDGNLHTSMAVELEGRRLLVTLPEYPLRPSVYFLDATDYGNITLLGTWAPLDPGALDGDTRTFSPHNFQTVGGRVYLAMYHGGIWVLDASSLDAVRAPAALAHAMPAQPRGYPEPLQEAIINPPQFWDVVVLGGVVYGSDMGGGLYAMHYEDDPLDPDWTSFA